MTRLTFLISRGLKWRILAPSLCTSVLLAAAAITPAAVRITR